jgi:hypothetical protein
LGLQTGDHVSDVKIAAFVAIASVLLSPLQPRAQTARSLKFAWPPGTTALVETDFVRRAGPDAAPEITSVRMTHRMRVLAHREGLDIRFGDQRHVDSSGDFRRAARALLHFWTPQTIVGADGTFARIEGGDRVQDLVVATLAPIQRLADDAPGLRALITPVISEGFLKAMQQLEWSKLAWQWIGMSSNQARLEIPGFDQIVPGVEMPATRIIEILERTRCVRVGTPYDCLTLQMRISVTDTSAMRATLEGLFQAATAEIPLVQPENLEHVVRVTLEMATMLPHDALETNSVHGTIVVNGSPVGMTVSDRRHSRFIYDSQ